MAHTLQPNRKPVRLLGMFLYSFGILLGMAVFGLLTWANYEAYFYFGYDASTAQALDTFSCPFMMTIRESGTVSIDLANPAGKVAQPYLKVDISNPGVMRAIRTKPSLPPGETQHLQWTVTRDDMVFGGLIIAKAYVFSYTPYPDRQGICGILVTSLPYLNGNQIFILALALTLASIVIGYGMWAANSRPLRDKSRNAGRAMVILAVAVLAGILVGMLRWWGLSTLMFGIDILLIVSMLGYFVL